ERDGDPWVLTAATFLVGLILSGHQGPDPAVAQFRSAFQQASGPAMAKGCEDTAFYRAVGLRTAAEVGADIADPVTTIAAFHDANRTAARGSLVPLATHDTKHGADLRVR